LILLPAIAAGIVIALLRGGSLRHMAALPLRLGWLAILCLMAQIYVIYSPADRLEVERTLHAFLLVGSSSVLVLFVWVNRSLPAMPVIALGLLLNLLVMSTNGGFMPVSREATMAAGTRSAQDAFPEGARLPKSKDVLLSIENTQLWLLSDAIVAPAPLSRVYSAGDLVVGVGVFLLFQKAMVPAGRRRADKLSKVAVG